MEYFKCSILAKSFLIWVKLSNISSSSCPIRLILTYVVVLVLNFNLKSTSIREEDSLGQFDLRKTNKPDQIGQDCKKLKKRKNKRLNLYKSKIIDLRT
ncbi:hypothetical protein H8356DRAFT_1353891 [Neocallimastix lanati (nom. inval.)]|nr:hypothetical protein H8356DRAFT_1353891 [Neocallimastix sp. JGI-2020a]